MPVPIVPDGPHAIAFQWYADRLQAVIDDGPLAGQVDVFRRASGNAEDFEALPPDLVGIQLKPEMAPVTVISNYAGKGYSHIVSSPITVYILVQTPGSAASDSFNIIDIIEENLSLGDSTDYDDAFDHWVTRIEWLYRPLRSIIKNHVQSYSAIRIVLELVR